MSETKEKILLCFPVAPAILEAAKVRFPQFLWKEADGDTEAFEIADAAIVFGKPRDRSLEAAARLKWLQAPSAGVERLATSDVFQKGSFVLTTAAGMHESCAQHALALLLGFSRRVALHARRQDALHWKTRDEVPMPAVLTGALGVLGLGSIGRRVCELGRALGMRTLGVSYHGTPVPEADEVHPIAALDGLLPRFDALIMILPATPETDGLLNAARLALLPRHCIVVNVGRGNAIDEPALIESLRSGGIAGAALDVFQDEPLPDNSPFYALPNVILTPHIGGNRPDYDECAFEVFLDNLERYAAGKPLRNVVDRKRGY